VKDSEFIGSGSGHNGQIDARNGGTIIADNLYIHDGNGIGVYADQGGIIKISNSMVVRNGHHGMSAQNGSTIIASGMTIIRKYHRNFKTVDSKHDGTYLQLTNSYVGGSVSVNYGDITGSKMYFDNVTVDGNVSIYGATFIAKNSRINSVYVETQSGLPIPNSDGYFYNDPRAFARLHNAVVGGRITNRGGQVTITRGSAGSYYNNGDGYIKYLDGGFLKVDGCSIPDDKWVTECN